MIFIGILTLTLSSEILIDLMQQIPDDSMIYVF